MMDCLPDTASMLRVARQYLRETSALRSARDAEPASAGMSMLVQTTTDGSYPTTASSVFACLPVEMDAEDTEGATATGTPDSQQNMYVCNLGSSVPPQGTLIIAHAVGGRWCIRYDG